MTVTTSGLGTRNGRITVGRVRRLALAVGTLLRARWNSFVEAGQLGPGAERSISRHTGARI
jgi:hypothetical protein